MTLTLGRGLRAGLLELCNAPPMWRSLEAFLRSCSLKAHLGEGAARRPAGALSGPPDAPQPRRGPTCRLQQQRGREQRERRWRGVAVAAPPPQHARPRRSQQRADQLPCTGRAWVLRCMTELSSNPAVCRQRAQQLLCAGRLWHHQYCHQESDFAHALRKWVSAVDLWLT